MRNLAARQIEHGLRPAWRASPVVAVDAMLAAAIRIHADLVWIEPSPLAPDHYAISLERSGAVLMTAQVSSAIGSAVIARLARIADVELPTATPVSGVANLRGDDRDVRLVLTIRPGTDLRAEAMLVERSRPLLGVVENRELRPGSRIGHYRVLSMLGAGGMGCVYAVEHVTLEQRYALKVLHHTKHAHPDRTDQFLREARAAARLRHASIIDVFDFGYLADHRPYFVMELIEGQSIAQLTANTALAPGRALALALQLADALATAHEGGVIHADVSASNVLVVDRSERVKLLDFGLSEQRQDATDAPTTIADVVCGTPCYIAPERIRGYPADEASDQYSFGALLFEMLTGSPPFAGTDVEQICRMHLERPAPEPLSPFGPLPDQLVDTVARLLCKLPGARYPTMRAVHADLTTAARRVDRQGWRRWLP